MDLVGYLFYQWQIWVNCFDLLTAIHLALANVAAYIVLRCLYMRVWVPATTILNEWVEHRRLLVGCAVVGVLVASGMGASIALQVWVWHY